jgi:transposase InsO family protein
MFQQAIQGQSQSLPKYLSTDNDPLYRFHQWRANLRVLDVVEIKTVPFVPLSHVERLVGTLRRECLDRTLFWTTSDLEAKLLAFRDYFNGYRSHAGLQGRPPEPIGDELEKPVSLISYRWKKHCRGLYQTPIAA